MINPLVQEFETVDQRVFWLTVSRIAELTIKLAGDYADSSEFQAAGDLLVNPRRIDENGQDLIEWFGLGDGDFRSQRKAV